jgi:tetratricopeptide (TPR) repeat protein
MRFEKAPGTFRMRPWHVGALFFGLALFCYWPALLGGLVWDDLAHVTRRDLQSLAGLRRIWFDLHATQQYYPVLHSAFWIEHRLWGDANLGYHLLNVALHSVAAGLLVLLLRRLKVPGALLAGTIFLVHPVCVESVAWISEQKNTLSLVFYLWSALAYLRFDDERERTQGGGASAARVYVQALALFVLALLTKSVCATLPAALLVIFWWKRGRLSWRRDVLCLVPWFALAIFSGLFTAWVERRYNGAIGSDFELTLARRFLLSGRIIWFYLGKLLWPTRLAFIYPHWDIKSAGAAWTAYWAAAVALTAVLWWCRVRWRGPLAAWLFFVGSLFPALGFFNVYPFLYSYVADHFQYLPSLGIFTAAAAGFALWLARRPPGVRAAARFLCAGLVATLALLSREQSRNYRDVTALYTATIAQNPDCFLAHNNLGIEFERTGRAAEAEAEYRAAIASKPDLAEAHYNLGHLCLRLQGRGEDAIAEFQEALRLKPDYPEAHDNLGTALAQLPGRSEDAIAQYREALRLRPDYPEAQSNLGIVLCSMGRTSEAIPHFEAALRLRRDAQTYVNLGKALLVTPGRLQEGIAQFEAALRMRPDAAVHVDLAIALLRVPGRRDEAVAHLEEALRLQPTLEPARRLLDRVRGSFP